MRYFLIAGEASGDLHGANLVKQLTILDKKPEFFGWGGDKMSAAGVRLSEHYKNTAFMGFVEVLIHLRTILGFLDRCKKEIMESKPDTIILLDYPGFNLRIAKWAFKQGFHVVYYITPQVWAWHQSRVHTLGKFTHLLLTILPFEEAFFKKFGYEAKYVGHPLLDAIGSFQPSDTFQSKFNSNNQILALLPGSRKQEILLMLPIMLEAIKNVSDTVLLAGAPAIPDHVYETLLEKHKVKGRVTLIVCYKGSPLSVAIAKRLVNLPFISLVNLIADKEIVRELIQDELTVSNLLKELDSLDQNREKMLDSYRSLIGLLGKSGASQKAAESIYNQLTYGEPVGVVSID
ncbi:MAG: lipid-A-disaccharide synthase [Saprospiraceae bacterium]|nr:lipid-A-disaccharide synthase [Saprospiraceae bacterium]